MNTWPTKKLGEVCEIVGGGTPSTSVSEYWNGDVVWITPKDMGKLDDVEIFDSSKKITEEGLKKSSAKLLPKGAVILSSRAPIGYVAIAGVPLATNQGCRSFICDGSKLYNRYLLHFLLTQTEYLNMLGGGSTFKEISGSKLKELEIPLPPLAEQKKIVAKLERVLVKISEAKKLRAEARENADNLLPAELRKIFEEGEKKGWEEKELESLIDTITPPEKIQKKNFKKDGKYPIIDQSQDEISGWTNDPASLVNIGKPVVIFGDHTCAVKYSERPFAQGADGIKILSTNQDLLPRFLFIVLKNNPIESEGYRRHFSKLKQFKIPLPPLEEQKRIVKHLDSLSQKLQKLQEYQKSTQSDLLTFEQAILHKAFSPSPAP